MPKLLFMDDEKSHESLINICFRQEIKQHKYEISFARNGEEALKIIDENKPDLLLTDLKVPEKQMDGFELIRTIRAKQINLETIVVSAYSGLDNITESVKYDVLCFVPKPFELAGLKSLIDLSLKKKSDPLLLKEPKEEPTQKPLTLTKAARILPVEEKLQLINNIIETLPTQKLKQLQETLPDFLAAQIEVSIDRKRTVEILKEKQLQGKIPGYIPLDSFLKIIKRPIKTNGVEYGPYYYIVWRDENGRSTSKCIGPQDPRSMNF